MPRKKAEAPKSEDLRIQSIKVKGKPLKFKELECSYLTIAPTGEPVRCEFTSTDHPKHDLFTALNQFTALMIEAVGLDETVWEEAWVSGVKFGDEKWYATIQRRDEEDKAIVVPHGLDIAHIPEDLTRSLLTQCLAYLNGDRLQMSLNLEVDS
jgi:hypothetical protein